MSCFFSWVILSVLIPVFIPSSLFSQTNWFITKPLRVNCKLLDKIYDLTSHQSQRPQQKLNASSSSSRSFAKCGKTLQFARIVDNRLCPSRWKTAKPASVGGDDDDHDEQMKKTKTQRTAPPSRGGQIEFLWSFRIVIHTDCR